MWSILTNNRMSEDSINKLTHGKSIPNDISDRFGIFYVTNDVIVEMTKNYRKWKFFWSNFIITDIDFDINQYLYKYFAHSPYFNRLQPHENIPIYQIEITDADGTKLIQVHRKEF